MNIGKKKILKLWSKIAETGGVALGCASVFFVFFGIVAGVVFLLKWLWSLAWVKNAAGNVGNFLVEKGSLFEYIFIGGFLLYLIICIVLGIVAFISDKKDSIVKGAKTAWEWFLKIIFILFLIALCLFSLHECFHNSPDIEPQLYEHRL